MNHTEPLPDAVGVAVVLVLGVIGLAASYGFFHLLLLGLDTLRARAEEPDWLPPAHNPVRAAHECFCDRAMTRLAKRRRRI